MNTYQRFVARIEAEFDKHCYYERAKESRRGDEFIEDQINCMSLAEALRRLCRAIDEDEENPND
jgi:hypothetical protein